MEIAVAELALATTIYCSTDAKNEAEYLILFLRDVLGHQEWIRLHQTEEVIIWIKLKLENIL